MLHGRRLAYLCVNFKLSYARDVRKIYNDFAEGEEIVIDPDLQPESEDDCVLVRLKDGTTMFRRYRPRAQGAFDLVADNPIYPTISVGPADEHEMLGVVIEHRRRRRRKKI